MKKYHLISLGCPKNLVDSEKFASNIEKANFLHTDNIEEAETIIINTCGFILDAKEESIQTILEAAEAKEKGTCKQLIVTGCLVQRYLDDLQNSIPEVDHFIDLKDFDTFANLLEIKKSDKRKLLTPNHYAYLRISDGCDNHCSYCAIPSIRGRFKSEKIDKLVSETIELTKQGVKEIIITAQDTAMYGKDIYKKDSLVEILKRIDEIEQIEWIRLLYLHPAHITDEILNAFNELPKLIPYFEMPLQHINNEILASMNRKVSKERIIEIIENIRNNIPNAVIRTTFIVGYPGESEENFQELKEFIKEQRFERLGVFTYSPEENTKAFDLPNQISEEIAESRKDELMMIQQDISADFLAHQIGKVHEVIIDKVSEESDFSFEGRTYFDSPEIDGVVFITDKDAEIGKIYQVEIIDSWEYDLVGKIIKK
ncbi:MAG: 30S ribosomal protein S12 methylthiotransferase RimO [Candidatus Cloacimonetes bacterium]|nr:30S ribosomal protein S12 methylthiotransferase RimO [Candidatus Cloacimonadota bacterium]